ncbi:hypothetical protein [Streptomyces sp. B6B3]|uniref:hypothetical protein n=1 Tax=Streptomyces sp. B6B3 TaxID=3153570 RepID=UPI00325E2AC6
MAEERPAEAGLLRVGPGVPPSGRPTAMAVGVWRGVVAPPEWRRPTRRRRRRRVLRELRRYTVAGTLLLAVLCYLLWQRTGPELRIEGVVLTAGAGPAGCGETVEVVAVVRTNGGAGSFRYHWVRSDGGATEAREERLPRDRDEARLRLLWTFQGEGVMDAVAELRITEPTRYAADVRVSYRCP